MAYSIDPIQDNCYPDTTVLINKLDIRDVAALNEAGGDGAKAGELQGRGGGAGEGIFREGAGDAPADAAQDGAEHAPESMG